MPSLNSSYPAKASNWPTKNTPASGTVQAFSFHLPAAAVLLHRSQCVGEGFADLAEDFGGAEVVVGGVGGADFQNLEFLFREQFGGEFSDGFVALFAGEGFVLG
jgi:hypothetical protein